MLRSANSNARTSHSKSVNNYTSVNATLHRSAADRGLRRPRMETISREAIRRATGSPRLAFGNIERRIREIGFAVDGCGSYIDYARA